MSATTSGVYRVLLSPRDPDELLLCDVETTDPTYVPTDGYGGSLAEQVAALEPGNRIEATIEWNSDGNPTIADCETLTHTRIEFIDGVTGIFEAARETAQEAAMQGAAMGSRVTKSTDGQDNGVCYTFAKQSGQRDLFSEFREGITPLEPLLDRVDDGGVSPPYDVFVLRPVDETFLVVYIALERDGLLARTVRETYANG